MSSQHSFFSRPEGLSDLRSMSDLDTETSLPATHASVEARSLISFWHDRCVACLMVLALALYYLVANPTGEFHLTHLQDPLYSLPFLLLFAVLAWYRLPIAVALVPLTLPYYYYPKTVYHTAHFSMAEITLWTCLAVALAQAVLQRRRWPYWLSWPQLRERVGPFIWPIVVFLLAAGLSILVAYARDNAIRAFREEVLGPLLFLGLALFCLRTRQDVTRLVLALLLGGLLLALIGTAQYLPLLSHGLKSAQRISVVYGSGNDVGLFFDYALPIALALLFSRLAWRWRLLALLVCIPVVLVLYGSGSRGSFLIAIPLALVFTVLFALRQRKHLLIGGALILVLAAGTFTTFHGPITDYVINGHVDNRGDSTALKRPLLWETALDMIHDYPWLGVGMDNWLCHYSDSVYNVCWYPLPHTRCWNFAPPQCFHWLGNTPAHPKLKTYWITRDAYGKSTGMASEPTLSHPHNIFLHVWVSIGIFGLLAFIALLVLFWWTFARVLSFLRQQQAPAYEWVRWLLIGIGAAMLAALAQGQIDSSFLEQDLAFCFWTLVTTLLLVRSLTAMPWKALLPSSTRTRRV